MCELEKDGNKYLAGAKKVKSKQIFGDFSQLLSLILSSVFTSSR